MQHPIPTVGHAEIRFSDIQELVIYKRKATTGKSLVATIAMAGVFALVILAIAGGGASESGGGFKGFI
ncbi:MAG: hypothetical protein CME26_14445 [Gemmatimonadetes bacterium]|nr:hypothetical protein [Gemmatimonadota bacterium]